MASKVMVPLPPLLQLCSRSRCPRGQTPSNRETEWGDPNVQRAESSAIGLASRSAKDLGGLDNESYLF